MAAEPMCMWLTSSSMWGKEASSGLMRSMADLLRGGSGGRRTLLRRCGPPAPVPGHAHGDLHNRATCRTGSGHGRSRCATARRHDGTTVTVRGIEPGDKDLLLAAFERLSEHSRYRRFMSPMPTLPAALVASLTDVDHCDHEALIAVEPASGRLTGVARYIRSRDGPAAAEVAVTVADDWHRRGVGRVLLELLTERARREGVERFTALMLAENRG